MDGAKYRVIREENVFVSARDMKLGQPPNKKMNLSLLSKLQWNGWKLRKARHSGKLAALIGGPKVFLPSNELGVNI